MTDTTVTTSTISTTSDATFVAADTTTDIQVDTTTDIPVDTTTNIQVDSNGDLATSLHVPQQYNDASYFQYQQGLFYELLADCLCKWVDQVKSSTVDNGVAKPQIRSFIDTWTYALYTRGIKRRMSTYGPDLPDLSGVQTVDELPDAVQLRAQGVIGQSPDADAAYLAAAKSGNAFQRVFYGRSSSVLLQFYYDKQATGFVKTDPLTMFCRHLVFDLNSMSIISVGVPGALSYDAFMSSQGSDGVCIEEFLEGTMVVYNQRLGMFGQQSVAAQEPSEGALGSPGQQSVAAQEPSAESLGSGSPADTTTQKQPKHDWALSTRRKLGTSFFNNPGKTFDQMFRENNTSTGTEFGDLDYLADKALVFNVEHTENRVVNPQITNRNTLVAVYQLPTNFDAVRASVGGVLNAVFSVGVLQTPQNTADPSEYASQLKYAVMAHAATAEISQLPIQTVVNDLAQLGVKGLRTPTRLFVYHGTDPLTVVSSMVANMDMYMPGVILKSVGETRRTKVRNPAHYELLKIKGSGPITISDRNKHNLFKVYWNLRQRGPDAVQQFLDVFDNKSATYKNIFTWYDVLISGMNHQLFQEYHNVFVRKSMPAQSISYAFKPLCGELHKIYKAGRQPVTRDTVIQFVGKLEHNQVYWRLFGIDA